MQKFDYIVVGSGLAGLYAAYKASFKGSVAVITKSFVREQFIQCPGRNCGRYFF